MDKSVCVRGANGLFIKALSVEHAALYSCGLRAHQCGAVLEILRTILRPYFELTVVDRQSLEMLLFLVGRCGIPACRAAEATIQVIVRDFEIRWCCPKQPLCFQQGIESGSMVPGEEPSL